jgi:hypothetical protein
LSRERSRGPRACWLVALPLALLLLVLAVGAAAAHHDCRLSGSSVSPRQVQAGGTVAVAVTYTDDAGSAPASVTVIVDQTPQAMSSDADAFKTGVRYTASITPSAGRHAISFSATDSTGGKETLWAGYVEVSSGDGGSGSTPTAAPTATVKPTSSATRTPAPTPRVGGGGDGSKGSGGGDGGSGSTPAPGGAASPSRAPSATTAPGAPVGPAPRSSAPPAAGGPILPTPTGEATDANRGEAPTSAPVLLGPGPQYEPSGGSTLRVGVDMTDQSARLAAQGNLAGWALAQARSGSDAVIDIAPSHVGLPALYHASVPALVGELAPTLATVTTGGAAWAAFVLFGKRRRDGDEPDQDPMLATAAATGVDTGAAPGLRVIDESLLPRWRRPSLQQVRKADPLRAVAEAPTMSFARSGVRPLDQYERRQIRYRLVRLLNSPDEVRASEIGILDRGDEVQLLERRGVYWRVLCPDGRTGWVHRMTLSEHGAEPSEAMSGVGQAVEAMVAGPFNPGPGGIGAGIASVDASPAARAENVAGLLEAYMRARSDGQCAAEADGQGVIEAPTADSTTETRAVETAASVDRAGTVETTPAAEASFVLARDYLERAGFAVRGPQPVAKRGGNRRVASAAQPVVRAAASPAAVPAVAQPAADAAAEPAEAAEFATDSAPATVSVESSSGGASPVAEPERAGGRYSERKRGGSRKASTESRPGTRSRRPSQ